MSVHSRPSIQYKDGMELRDRKMTKDCTQPTRIGNIRALARFLVPFSSQNMKVTIQQFLLDVLLVE